MSSINEKELKFLFTEREVELGGQTFTIKPFNFIQTQIVARKLKGALDLLGDFDMSNIAELYADNYEGLRDIISLVFNLKKETVDSFDLEAATIAISEIIIVNKDFFTQRVQTIVNNAQAKLGMDGK